MLALLPNISAIKRSTLKDIAKPHLGVYECRQAQFGKEDLLTDYSRIELELKSETEFVVHYVKKNGEKHRMQGSYVYDKEKGSITMQLSNLQGIKREFPLQDGVLTITLPIFHRQLALTFEQK